MTSHKRLEIRGISCPDISPLAMPPRLTSTEVSAVQSDWKALAPDSERAQGVATALLQKLFTAHPEYKKLFSFLRGNEDKPWDDVVAMPGFKKHVEVLAKYVTIAINGLNDQEATKKIFEKQGATHKPRDVRTEHCRALATCLLELVDGKASDMEAWRKFSLFISEDMARVCG